MMYTLNVPIKLLVISILLGNSNTFLCSFYIVVIHVGISKARSPHYQVQDTVLVYIKARDRRAKLALHL